MSQKTDKSAGCVRVEKAGTIGWLVFDNPTRRNALTLAMWQQLREAVEQLERDNDIRVVVMKGAGDKAFASGGDISEFAKVRSNAEQKAAYSAISGEAQKALRAMSKPLIAAIGGYCIGGGLILALAADIRFAAATSRFGVPAAKLGLGYEYANVAALARLIGPSAALDIIFSARHLSADEALQVGLLNFVCVDSELDVAVTDYAKIIGANAPLTVAAAKVAIRAFAEYSNAVDSSALEAMVDQCFDSKDYREGWNSFLEKRIPKFSGI